MVILNTFKSTKYRILLYAGLGTFVFAILHFYFQNIFPMYLPKYYPSFHIILEFFSISISLTIFSYGWKVFSYSKSRRLLLLSFVLLTAGVIDLLHTLSFESMPFFIEEASIHNSIWFWLISRATASILVFIILLLPEKRLKSDPRFPLFFLVVLYISLVTFFIFNFGDKLPPVVIEGQGTTFVKNVIEYFVSFLYLSSMIVVLIDYVKTKKIGSLFIILAFYFLLLSELIFTVYQNVYDFDNFIGHIFKVLGYFFIMKGYYFSRITEDKIAEEKLFLAREELDNIIREQQGIIFKFTKQENKYVHSLCDGELLNKFGVKQEDERKKSLEDYLPAYADFLLYHYDLAWNSGQKVTFEIDYSELAMFVSLKPIIVNGQVKEVIGSVTDITKIKNMEDMVRSSEKLGVLGELAAGIAHEVRNPLTTLKGFLQLINSDMDKNNQKYITLMLDEVDRIEQITNEFMAAAKPQALHYTNANIIPIINQVVALMQPQAILNGVQINVNVNDSDKIQLIHCEKNHLKQVFINLLKNAFEAMPTGGSLTITVEQEKNFINLYFIDTGLGIPEDALKKLGEPFFTLKEKGNGLGLMMCKKIIQDHNGMMNVTSKINEGTSFKITFPASCGNE